VKKNPVYEGFSIFFIATLFVFLFLLFWKSFPVLAKEPPKEIAGVKLGGKIEDSMQMIKKNTMLQPRFTPFLQEVETIDIPGYDYGLLWIGNCEEPGRILRIKMKYADPSREFYEKLLERLRKRYGKPTEWRGDPFHAHLAWKWAFADDKGNDISMILEHNVRDPDESSGNTIKLTLWNLVQREKACYKSNNPKNKKTKSENNPGWELLMPK
jgi:hypothetical protein